MSSDEGAGGIQWYSLSVLVFVERQLAVEWHVAFRADVVVVLQCVRHVRAIRRCFVRIETERRKERENVRTDRGSKASANLSVG